MLWELDSLYKPCQASFFKKKDLQNFSNTHFKP